MSDPARIALVCEGDAESADKAFSGTAKSMIDHLRLLDHQVTAIDVKLYHPLRALVAARSFSPNRGTWRARFRYGKEGFRARSSHASRAFASKWERFDLILQIGATFEPPGRGEIPYALYCDWNMALSIRDRQIAQSAVHHLTLEEATEINELQRAIYRRAAAIFTISERLRGSFIEDYRIPADRVITAHAGPNIELAKIPSRPPDRPAGRQPTILFIGKEFRRKGGDLALDALRVLRREFPDVRLLIVGPRGLEVDGPGVEVHGFLRKDVPTEFGELIRLYMESDVFCLPTRHDPFPTVVREAMFFGLPCVTSDIWAMPEMVVDGETGFTVPVDDVASLADRLSRILRDPSLGRRMGEAGRRRAEQHFTWEMAARKMHERIEVIVQGG